MLLDPLPNLTRVGRASAPQGPQERPPSFGEIKTSRARVKVRTSPREPAVNVGNQLDERAGALRDDAEQCGFVRLVSAPHARAHRSVRA